MFRKGISIPLPRAPKNARHFLGGSTGRGLVGPPGGMGGSPPLEESGEAGRWLESSLLFRIL